MLNAYCNECGARVMLAEDGGCANGHARSALRDVREGAIAAAPAAITGPAGVTPAPERPGAGTGQPNLAPSQELAARSIGIAIVAIPAAIVVAAAYWSSYAASMAVGMTKSTSMWSSIGSVVLTAGMIALWVAKRRMHLRK